MKKIIFTLSILLPTIIKAEGIDKKIDKAFQPISDFFSQLIFFADRDVGAIHEAV